MSDNLHGELELVDGCEVIVKDISIPVSLSLELWCQLKTERILLDKSLKVRVCMHIKLRGMATACCWS